jgi:ubiquitin-protein ligase
MVDPHKRNISFRFIFAVLLIIRNMLSEPNIDSPLEEEVAEQYRNKKADFVKTAKEWTKKYAAASK